MTAQPVAPRLPLGVESIFPIGDSIMFGAQSDNGYPATADNVQIMEGIGGDGTTACLDQVWNLIAGAGLTVVGENGTGSDTQFFRGSIPATTFNRLGRNNEGHGGWGLSSINGFVPAGNAIATQFAALWAVNPADMILLMAGVVDLFNGASGVQCAEDLDDCLTAIAAAAPGIPVLYVFPPLGSGTSAKGPAYRAAAAPVITAHIAAGMKLWTVDAGLAGLQSNIGGNPGGALFEDNREINYHGHRVLAGVIFRALVTGPY
jgi:hypothetical protein